MRKRNIFDNKMLLEKYLGKRDEEDTIGDLIGNLLKKFSETKNKEGQLQLVLYMILLILSSEEDY